MTALQPLPHQAQALRQLLASPWKLVSWEKGTGKTALYLWTADALYRRHGGRHLLLVPASLIEQVEEEAARCIPETWRTAGHVLDNRHSMRERAEALKAVRAGLVLLSHEALSYRDKQTRQLPIRDALLAGRWGSVHVDEGSRFRNWSIRTRVLLQLGQRADRRYLYTGSLIVNSPADAWYPLRFLDPRWCTIPPYGTLTRRQQFERVFCLFDTGYFPKPIGANPKTAPLLRRRLGEIGLDCRLADLVELPARSHETVRVDLGPQQAKAYRQLRDELLLELQQLDDAAFQLRASTYAVRVQKLQEITAGAVHDPQTGQVLRLPSAKTAELVSLLQDNRRTPTIVWTWFQAEHELVAQALQAAGLPFAGLEERHAFLDGKVDILLAPLGRGAYGFNLDRARLMVFHSLCWDAERFQQALDRNWRLTTREPKHIVYLVARKTVDERIKQRLTEKAAVARTLTRSELLDLLQ